MRTALLHQPAPAEQETDVRKMDFNILLNALVAKTAPPESKADPLASTSKEVLVDIILERLAGIGPWDFYCLKQILQGDEILSLQGEPKLVELYARVKDMSLINIAQRSFQERVKGSLAEILGWPRKRR